MYLKSLDVVGFKSFADRTKLEFHRGVTAIVGPNGCGKSNVLDSIRWVLGEQSAKALRGGEMKDVIFSGTDQRPPLGMAEVSLTFGDCEEQLGTEYNEVTITRRVFRDGASEYELNKTPCRLRDIHQLFMDTGVGRSAYSIMEQGKIDQILSSRPEDRRAIFEEAAGITKYKSQKKEALRKLENTEANLVRLADIIREVKRQIGSLQRQAGKARRYQASFAELAVLEQKLGRHQFDTYSTAIDTLQAEVDGARERQQQLDEEVTAQEAQLAAARGELSVLEAELVRLRDEQARQRHALERAEQRATTNHARVEEFLGLRDQAEREIAATEEKIRVAEENLAHLNAQVENFRRQREETQEKFDAEQEALHMLTARIGMVEGECAEIEERRNAEERRQPEAGAGTGRVGTPAAKFSAAARDAAGRADHAAPARRGGAGRAHPPGRAACRGGDAIWPNAARRSTQARQAQREAEEKLRAAEKSRNESRRRRGRSCRPGAMRWRNWRPSTPTRRRPRSVYSIATPRARSGRWPRASRCRRATNRRWRLLLGDAVHALLLPDDGAARDWRAKVAAREICVFAPLSSARPAPLPRARRRMPRSLSPRRPMPPGCLPRCWRTRISSIRWPRRRQIKAAQPQSVVATRSGELITRPRPRPRRAGSGRDVAGGLHAPGGIAAAGGGVARIVRAPGRGGKRGGSRARLCWTSGPPRPRPPAPRCRKPRSPLATVRQEERAAQVAAAEATRQAEEAAREIHRLSVQENADHERHEQLREAIAAADAAVRAAADELETQQNAARRAVRARKRRRTTR